MSRTDPAAPSEQASGRGAARAMAALQLLTPIPHDTMEARATIALRVVCAEPDPNGWWSSVAVALAQTGLTVRATAHPADNIAAIGTWCHHYLRLPDELEEHLTKHGPHARTSVVAAMNDVPWRTDGVPVQQHLMDRARLDAAEGGQAMVTSILKHLQTAALVQHYALHYDPTVFCTDTPMGEAGR